MVVFHPFFTLRNHLSADKYTKIDYPEDKEIAQFAEPILWSSIVERLSLQNNRELNRTLLTYTGALRTEFQQKKSAASLADLMADASIWPPLDGEFAPLFLSPFLAILLSAGYDQIVARDEFGEQEQVFQVPKATHDRRLLLNSTPFIPRCLESPDGEVVAMVHWDSFFTVVLGALRFSRGFNIRRLSRGFGVQTQPTIPGITKNHFDDRCGKGRCWDFSSKRLRRFVHQSPAIRKFCDSRRLTFC